MGSASGENGDLTERDLDGDADPGKRCPSLASPVGERTTNDAGRCRASAPSECHMGGPASLWDLTFTCERGGSGACNTMNNDTCSVHAPRSSWWWWSVREGGGVWHGGVECEMDARDTHTKLASRGAVCSSEMHTYVQRCDDSGQCHTLHG
jgi:hypothetical protein